MNARARTIRTALSVLDEVLAELMSFSATTFSISQEVSVIRRFTPLVVDFHCSFNNFHRRVFRGSSARRRRRRRRSCCRRLLILLFAIMICIIVVIATMIVILIIIIFVLLFLSLHLEGEFFDQKVEILEDAVTLSETINLMFLNEAAETGAEFATSNKIDFLI